MVSIHSLSSPLDDAERRSRTFAGDIFIFTKIPAVKRLVEETRALSQSSFNGLPPLTAHNVLSKEDYLRTIENIMRTYSHDGHFKGLQIKALEECGVNLEESGWCRATLRIQPPNKEHADRLTGSLGPHRDVWYANMFHQTNWWAPIFPLEPGRTLALYPRYWSEPIPNRTEGWSLDEFRRSRQKVTESGGTYQELRDAYPSPLPTTPPDTSHQLRIVLEPGDIMCFSAAHLHEGIINNTDQARFSTDFRTLNINDVKEEIGAPNIDTHSTGSALVDFCRLTDSMPLTEIV